uniref:CapZ-interacting protein n=1 Tax=Fundulus heteroclitus TaxID=8078 RepID=A0A3Q2PGI0_FUNHE
MEKEAPPRRSVAELAGKFKGPAPQPHGAAGNQADKAVRRRPPRTLPLPNAHTDLAQPPSGAASPPKARRNSALIEKLQANLTLVSPTAAPLKSPGLKMLPPGFPPAVPMVTTSSTTTPTSPAPASPLTESPTSFEAPPSAGDGNILQSINKGRARVSIRRRPPSRRHRKSSSGDDVGVGHDVADTHLSSGVEGQEKTSSAGGGGGGGGGEEEGEEVFMEEGPTEASTQRKETGEDEETKSSTDVKEKEEEEEEEEGTCASQQMKVEEDEEEKACEDKQQKAAAEETTNQEEEAKV